MITRAILESLSDLKLTPEHSPKEDGEECLIMGQSKLILEALSADEHRILTDKEAVASVPEELYHATLKAFEGSINNRGLVAGGGGDPVYGWNDEPLVFMATTREYACHFVDVAPEFVDDEEDEERLNRLYKASEMTGVIYVIDTNQLDHSKLRLDPNFPQYDDDYSLSFVYAGNIPTSALIRKSYFPLDGRYTGY